MRQIITENTLFSLHVCKQGLLNIRWVDEQHRRCSFCAEIYTFAIPFEHVLFNLQLKQSLKGKLHVCSR